MWTISPGKHDDRQGSPSLMKTLGKQERRRKIFWSMHQRWTKATLEELCLHHCQVWVGDVKCAVLLRVGRRDDWHQVEAISHVSLKTNKQTIKKYRMSKRHIQTPRKALLHIYSALYFGSMTYQPGMQQPPNYLKKLVNKKLQKLCTQHQCIHLYQQNKESSSQFQEAFSHHDQKDAQNIAPTTSTKDNRK